MELFWVDGVEMLLEDYIWDESLEAYKKCMNLWSLHDGELDSMVQFLELCSLHLRNMDTRHTPACKFCVLGGKKNILFKKIPLILHMFLKIFKVVNLLLFWKHQINIKICLIYIYVCLYACEGWTTPTREQWWRMWAGFLFLVYWRMWRMASSGFWKHLINNRRLHG